MQHPEVLIELGAVIVGLAVLSRLAGRIGIPTIPLYLSAGLAFGEGGILPLVTAESFVSIGAEIGLILLLFMLGLEHSAAELISTLRTQRKAGLADLLLNFTPGFGIGLILDFGFIPAVLLGGVTYVSSSGIVARLLGDLKSVARQEVTTVLSIVVIEDLAMALYLPVVGALLVGDHGFGALASALAAIGVVILALAAASRIEVGISRLIFSKSDEALLLTIMGLTLLIAGAAESLKVSAAVAALLVGIMLSGPAAESARSLLSPMRDLFAALFFGFVGLSVDPSQLLPVLGPALGLAALGIVTKLATGWLAGGRIGVGPHQRLRAGAILVARGEFSIAIAGLATAAGVATRFEALAVAYVLLLAVLGPILARVTDRLVDRLPAPSESASYG